MSQRIRIAVPTDGDGGLDAQRSAHFGHADSFTIVDVQDGDIVGAQTMKNAPHTSGGCGTVVASLASAGVTAAVVVGMGGGPLAAMSRLGMTAYFDDTSITPAQAATAYLTGELPAFGSTDVCSGH